MRTVFAVLALALGLAQLSLAQVDPRWKPNDPDRPLPPIIEPGTPSTQDAPGRPPSDAVVLFDGKDLSQWLGADGQPAKWKVADGYLEVLPHSGFIHTRQAFGDCQLHVEFAEPVPAVGESQGRGNSGVFLMGLYEIQVLDSYQNKTYADGQAAGVYGQFPPQVNASLPPGQWQMYDIIFHSPHFDKDGKVLRPARFTVLHNGVLVQDNVELSGPTAHHERPPYQATPDKLPLSLQDHGNPVRFRNLWIRELGAGQ
jgi:3-keto-disaccharide hydrolase